MISDQYNIVSLAYLHSKINFFIEPSLSLDHVFDFFSTHFFINREDMKKIVWLMYT